MAKSNGIREPRNGTKGASRGQFRLNPEVTEFEGIFLDLQAGQRRLYLDASGSVSPGFPNFTGPIRGRFEDLRQF